MGKLELEYCVYSRRAACNEHISSLERVRHRSFVGDDLLASNGLVLLSLSLEKLRELVKLKPRRGRKKEKQPPYQKLEVSEGLRFEGQVGGG